ncbi:MAG: hypothetical protein ACTS73_08635 [Arsenophonus sp. NEOnobi-MAG3]
MLRLKCLRSESRENRTGNRICFKSSVATALSEACKKRQRVAIMAVLTKHIHEAYSALIFTKPCERFSVIKHMLYLKNTISRVKQK